MRISTIFVTLLVLMSGQALADQAAEEVQDGSTAPACSGAAQATKLPDDPESLLKQLGLEVELTPTGGTWLIHCPDITDCPQGACTKVIPAQCPNAYDTGAEGCEQTACPTGQTVHILECVCDGPQPCLPWLTWNCQ